jgi:single-strand DNA-binding protein
VGNDPDLKYFESGTCKAALSIAVDGWNGKEEVTHWVLLEAWGKTAETIANFVRKGKQIGIQGSLKQETWQDQNGSNRSRLLVHVDRLQLLASPSGSEPATATAPVPAAPAPTTSAPAAKAKYQTKPKASQAQVAVNAADYDAIPFS